MPRSNSNLKKSISPRNYKITKPIEYTQTKENRPVPIQIQSQQPGFLSNVAQGFAWGTGTTIARNIFESKENITPSINKNTENNCFEYKLCQKLNDPEECFSKMNINEYTLCKKILE